jgi:SAM-dependent methyltransferase
MDTESVVREWREAFAKHPMFGEGMSRGAADRMWESCSATYSDARYSEIRDGIIDAVLSEGYLGEVDTLLDLGCGPGTFAVPFSGHCRSVVCVDSSDGMLSRIRERGIPNISTVRADCTGLSSDYEADVVFCSLCPPMNSPEGIDRMGILGKRRIYVSSANSETGIEGEIWHALGKEYSYEGYDTDYPYRYLRSMGARAEIRYFTQKNTVSDTVEGMVKRFRSTIAQYRPVGDAEERAIKEVVLDHSEDGTVTQTVSLRMGMLVW